MKLIDCVPFGIIYRVYRAYIFIHLFIYFDKHCRAIELH